MIRQTNNSTTTLANQWSRGRAFRLAAATAILTVYVVVHVALATDAWVLPYARHLNLDLVPAVRYLPPGDSMTGGGWQTVAYNRQRE